MTSKSSNIINNLYMKSRILSIVIIIVTIVIALFCAISGSESIILHWSLSGEAESYGPKTLILILPVISLIVFLVTVNQEKHGYDTSLLSEQSQKKINPKAIRNITPILLLLILYITVCSARMLSMMPIIPFSLIIIAIILFIYKSRKSTKQ